MSTLEHEIYFKNMADIKSVNADGLISYILDNDDLTNEINNWIKLEFIYGEHQIMIEIRNSIYHHFLKHHLSSDNKNGYFIDWIISDWLDNLLNVPYLLKELKKFDCIGLGDVR